MKDKKINKLLSDAEKNIGSLSEQIASELFESNKSDEQKLSEHKQSREDLDFGKYHKPKKIEMFSEKEPEQEPDLVEALASNISARLINEIARDVFGEEIETIEDVAPDVQDKFVEAVTEQVLETPKLVESKDFKLSEERMAELQEARVKSYVAASQKLSSAVIKENELLPTKQEIFEVLGDPTDPVTQAQLSQSMSTILIRIQQGLASLGGGGAGLAEVKHLIDSLDDKRQSILDSATGNLLNLLLGHIDSLGGDFDSFYTGLSTDIVPEGPSGENLYYRESRVKEFVDSDYVQERMSIPASLTFKGGAAVDVDSVADPSNGDVYVNDSEAVANSTWIGIAGQTIAETVALAWADSESPGTGGKWYKIGDVAQDNEQVVLDAENKAVPPGTISMWMGGSSPAGYFLCRGGSFDIARYPLLHAHLQASYSGYVSGTLPDFRGRFPGGDGAHGLDPLDGKRGRLFNQMTADPTTTGLDATTTHNMGVSSTATTTVNSNGSHSHTATSSASSTTTVGGGTVETNEAGNHRHRFGDAANVDGSKSGGRMYHNPDNGGAQTGYAGKHKHTVDLSSITASTSTSVSTSLANDGTHSHSATTNVNTSLSDTEMTTELDGWDPYTRPYAFNVNFIIKHDAE